MFEGSYRIQHGRFQVHGNRAEHHEKAGVKHREAQADALDKMVAIEGGLKKLEEEHKARLDTILARIEKTSKETEKVATESIKAREEIKQSEFAHKPATEPKTTTISLPVEELNELLKATQSKSAPKKNTKAQPVPVS